MTLTLQEGQAFLSYTGCRQWLVLSRELDKPGLCWQEASLALSTLF